MLEGVTRAKSPVRLPVVLTKVESCGASWPTHRRRIDLLGQLLYGSGLCIRRTLITRPTHEKGALQRALFPLLNDKTQSQLSAPPVWYSITRVSKKFFSS